MKASSKASLAVTVLICVLPGEAPAAGIALAAHRAVYDLTLEGQKQVGTDTSSIHGRMVYEFTGSACTDYRVSFRLVIQSESVDGDVTLTDTRTKNSENTAGDHFRFSTETYTNGVMTENSLGRAEMAPSGLTIRLGKPEERTLTLASESEVVFPSAHLVRIIAAAEQGANLLAIRAFDGSDGGDHLYDTTTVIGPEVDGTPEGIEASIGSTRRWPVTVTYFNADKTGDRTPDYAMSFDLWDNGVSSRMRLDYGAFALTGELIRFDALAADPCPPSPGSAAPDQPDAAPADPATPETTPRRSGPKPP